MGEIKYAEYKKEIDAVNAHCLESGSDWEIELMTESELFDAIQHTETHQFLNFLGGH